MASYTVRGAGLIGSKAPAFLSVAREVLLGEKIGKGATATIYRVLIAGEEFAAKIYNSPSNINVEKIIGMMENRPTIEDEFVGGRRIPLLTWPLALLDDESKRACGFLMYLADVEESFTFDFYYDSHLFKKLKSPEEAALSYKIEIAYNLAKIVADLHAHEHFIVDFKPQNIHIAKKTHTVTLLDCDGFSIKHNARRHPASLISTDYISPETTRNNISPEMLGEPQDLYALAVLIFQLLNNGIHPFQGILTDEKEFANTNDEKAAKGLYPHGQIANPKIRARPQSIHKFFNESIRDLFDRAFSLSGTTNRPTANEWAICLKRILDTQQLVRCSSHPSDFTHIKFRGKECPACYLNSLVKKPVEIVWVSPTVSPVPSPEKKTENTQSFGIVLFGFLILPVLFLGLIVGLSSPKNKPDSTIAAQPSPQIQAQSFGSDDLSQAKGEFSAIFVSLSGESIGYGLFEDSQEIARRRALEMCKANRNRDERCISVSEGTGSCVAIYKSSEDVVGAAISTGWLAASSSAFQECATRARTECVAVLQRCASN